MHTGATARATAGPQDQPPPPPRRVLVCGGRGFDDWRLLRFTLDRMHAKHPIGVLIHGAARGADQMAGAWAEMSGIRVEPYRVNPYIDGPWPAAGPRRNERMLREGKPDLVVAFPGGKGTAHMVKIARAAGVRVIEVSPREEPRRRLRRRGGTGRRCSSPAPRPR